MKYITTKTPMDCCFFQKQAWDSYREFVVYTDGKLHHVVFHNSLDTRPQMKTVVHTFFPDANRNWPPATLPRLPHSRLTNNCYHLLIIYHMPGIEQRAFLFINFFSFPDNPVRCCCHYPHLHEVSETWRGKLPKVILHSFGEMYSW